MNSKVFILYTGGTFGMKPTSETDQTLIPGTWEELLNFMPAVNENGYFSLFKDVDFTFGTLHEVVDSSNIKPATWQEIAAVIKDNYASHDGFVIIHGTDTMAYTASALSFVLQNLAKPVVITGSQLPAIHPRTDAFTNLSNAIYIAAFKTFDLQCIPEVCICFNDDILRGNRSVKSSTQDFQGFSAPNFDHLGWLEQDILINEKQVAKPPKGALEILDGFSDKVVNVTMFPGYDPAVILKLIVDRQVEGIVLKTFGSGNISDHPAWKDVVRMSEQNDVLILATTQCLNGSISLGKYQASQVLKSPNVIDGHDITSEAALTKLMWAIGNFDMRHRRAVLNQSLRGEMSLNIR